MPRVVKGRAGRENKRDEIMEEYGAALAQLLQAQVRPDPGARILHIGSAGAARLADALAHKLDSGEVVVCVYTYDELEDTRAALAGLGNVHVINDMDDLDEDEQRFDIVTCIASYHLGRDTALEQIEQGVSWLAPEGTLYLAGDKQREWDRYVEALSALVRDVQQTANRGQYRIATASGRNIRKTGRISGRRS